MSIRAAPVRSWTSRISSRIWAWIVTSRAVVGSSAMSSFGSHDRAIAIMTRWRMPPDSSCGYCLTRRSGLLIPTALSDSTAFSQAAFFDRPWWSITASAIWSPIVNTGFRLVIGSWKIIAMSLPRTWRISSSLSAEQVATLEQDLAGRDLGRRHVEQAHDRQRRHALPAAGLADDPERLAGHDREADAVDRPDDPVHHVEVGPQVADVEQRSAASDAAGGSGRER